MRGLTRRVLASAALSLGLAIGGLVPGAEVAHASGWTRLMGEDGGATVACKTLIPTLYGPLWRVKLMLVNWGSTVTHSTYAEVRRTYSDDLWNGTLIHSWSTTVGPFGTSSPGYVYLSPLRPDHLLVGFSGGGGAMGGPWDLRYITFC